MIGSLGHNIQLSEKTFINYDRVFHGLMQALCNRFVFIVSALSSIKSNIDNSNCILVQDVKAVTHAQGIRDALSTSSPSDGKFP